MKSSEARRRSPDTEAAADRPDASDASGLREFSRSLPMLLLRSHQAVMAEFRPILREHGITEQQSRWLGPPTPAPPGSLTNGPRGSVALSYRRQRAGTMVLLPVPTVAVPGTTTTKSLLPMLTLLLMMRSVAAANTLSRFQSTHQDSQAAAEPLVRVTVARSVTLALGVQAPLIRTMPSSLLLSVLLPKVRSAVQFAPRRSAPPPVCQAVP